MNDRLQLNLLTTIMKVILMDLTENIKNLEIKIKYKESNSIYLKENFRQKNTQK